MVAQTFPLMPYLGAPTGGGSLFGPVDDMWYAPGPYAADLGPVGGVAPPMVPAAPAGAAAAAPMGLMPGGSPRPAGAGGAAGAPAPGLFGRLSAADLGTTLQGLGMGLLEAGGFNRYPMSAGQGMARGMQYAQALRQEAVAADERRLRLQMLQEKAEAEREARAAAAAAAARRQEAALSLPGLTDIERAAIDAGMTEDVIGGRLTPPEGPDPTTLMRNLEAAGYTPGTPEFEAAMTRQLAKTSGTNVNIMPGPTFRGTPGGGTALVVTDPTTGETRVQEVIPGRDLEPTDAEARAASDAELNAALDEFLAVGESASGLSPADRADVEARRRELGQRLARARQPTGILTDKEVEQAIDEIPDPFGPIDSMQFRNRVEALKRARGAGRGDLPREERPTSAGPPAVSTDAEFNALPSGTQFVDPDGNIRVKP